LAAAQVVTGGPLPGVWLGMGLCCAALCWMLQGWLPPRWALLAALLATGRLVFSGTGFGAVGYWGNSYWCGAVPALGGALVLGAVRRLLRRPAARHALVVGVGLVVLANSRPYEGLLLSLPVLGLLLAWLAGRHRPAPVLAARRVLLPVVLVLAPAGAAMGWYNARVTGHPLVLPYQVHESTYAVVPLFLWQGPRPEPAYNHAVLRSFHTGWLCQPYRQHDSAAAVVRLSWAKAHSLGQFYLGITLAVPLVALPGLARDRWSRFALLTGGLQVAGLLLLPGVTPHYAAPATCLAFLVVVQSLRHLRTWRWQGRPVGRALATALVLNSAVLCVGAVLYAARSPVADDWSQERARLLRDLKGAPGQHLVIVRYAPDHREDQEWVYNEADIDRARVVWARERGPEHDRRLLDYFRDRQVWLLEADVAPPTLVPCARGPAVAPAKERPPPLAPLTTSATTLIKAALTYR
jgi:hypothetical protein